jgi:hypothetical protein
MWLLVKTEFLCLLICVSVAACGYRVASKNRLDTGPKTVAVVPFENRTPTFEVEQILTSALVRELVQRSDYEVVNDPNDADWELGGAVLRVRVSPVAFGQASFGSTFLVTLQASLYVLDSKSREVLFQNNNYTFRDQYVINVDLENFFSELNPALRRISDDFASSVVTSVMEAF